MCDGFEISTDYMYLLTIYDLYKVLGKNMAIDKIELCEKTKK